VCHVRVGKVRRLVRRELTGMVAGAVGTLAMDLFRYRNARRTGTASRFAEWELSSGRITSFADGGAPAEMGRRAADRVGVQIPDRWAGATQDVVHWSTGAGWGLVAAAVAGRRPGAGVKAGVATGVTAFATSYAVLGALGIYEPIWRYDRESLARDLAGHVIYGATTGAGLAGLAGLGVGLRRLRPRRPQAA